MSDVQKIIADVKGVYDWIYVQGQDDGLCRGCGRCCDFESFGHRLYVTTAEILYFRHFMQAQARDILTMTGGVCPYRVGGKCSVYEYRFAGCRIYNCKGDKHLQSELSEAAVESLAGVCEQNQVGYQYVDLGRALQIAGAEQV